MPPRRRGPVGDGDLARQVDQVVANTLAATWTQLRASPLADAFTTASTLLGVARLGHPGQLVELDVTAALD